MVNAELDVSPTVIAHKDNIAIQITELVFPIVNLEGIVEEDINVLKVAVTSHVSNQINVKATNIATSKLKLLYYYIFVLKFLFDAGNHICVS